MSDHYIDLQDAETSDLTVLGNKHFKSGLAKFSPQEGHIIRKDSPEGSTCMYIYRKGGTELEWRYNKTVSYAKNTVE
jgi:hypothetical protein